MKVFTQKMCHYGLFGKIIFDHAARKMTFSVGHLKNKSQEMENELPLSSLSGGERSRTVVCFIMALWEQQTSPIR
jgi:chromosome segregation ATPase